LLQGLLSEVVPAKKKIPNAVPTPFVNQRICYPIGSLTEEILGQKVEVITE
jgi:hypothetical protein